jgi:hypothetical protein
LLNRKLPNIAQHGLDSKSTPADSEIKPQNNGLLSNQGKKMLSLPKRERIEE